MTPVSRILQIVGLAFAGLAFGAGAMIVVSTCAGCGGLISAQARAATVATVALEGAHRLAIGHTEEALAACQDVPCVDAVEASMVPVATAHDVTRSVLSAWVDALRVAVVAGEDGDVVAALVTAASRLLSEWVRLVEALARVGVELPALPGFVLAAGGAL